ncbi:Retrovirus-related Pol polyprotein from transposon 17.6 [Quillaja saponaria]|uniref:Retrovirus-related Pol polyprotein from transposon 17.6 n=1 Tax=Quillaja saponaria TaxID=32244 RepID=A0AAD7KN14_QUISA|nr:Retrovirus-related Pol polyprotein from transposon 17.6 [Quillaja saponaria]
MTALGEISARGAVRSPPRTQRRIQFEYLDESSGSGRMAEVRVEPRVEYPVEHTEARHSFTKSVTDCPIPQRVKIPALEQYHGTSDPDDFVIRFESLMLLHDVPDQKSEFRNSMNRRKPKTLEELMNRAEEFINQEEADRDLVAPSYQPPKRQHSLEFRNAPPGRRRKEKGRDRREQSPSRLKFENYRQLNNTRTAVLLAAQSRGFLRFPPILKQKNKNMDSSKFCLFHRSPGYDTEDCFTLKDEIENLIRRGCLTEFVQQEGAKRARQDDRSRGEHSSRRFEQPRYNIKNVDNSRRPPRSPEDKGGM